MMKKMGFLMILSISAFFMVSTGFAAFDTSVDLMINGDFEDGGNDWNTGGGSIVADNGPSLPGTSCGELDNVADSGNRDYRSDQFDIVTNVEHRLTFDYKTEVGSAGQPQVRFRFYDNTGSWNGEGQQDLALTNGQWQTVEVTHTASDIDLTADIVFSSHTFGDFVGVVKFDNAVVNTWVSDDVARNPDPADDELYVPVEQTLSWDKPFNDSPDGYVLYIAEGIDPNWLAVTPEWSTADPNETSYDPAIDFAAGTTYSWRVDTSVTGDVWEFTTIPPIAFGPDPDDGETGVSPLRTCSWGDVPGALSYDVYWGTDEALVTAGNAAVYQGTQSGTSIAPAMDFTTQYFWRIDTNLSSGLGVGDVWDYTTDAPVCDPPMAGDTNDDCVVDINDFADLAFDWLRCTLINGFCP